MGEHPAPSLHDLARQVAALRTELRQTRRLVERLVTATQAAPDRPEPIALADGSRFLPGTGTLPSAGTTRQLSPAARAALEHLDAQETQHP